MDNATLVINKMSFTLTCTSRPRCDSVQGRTIGQALDNMKPPCYVCHKTFKSKDKFKIHADTVHVEKGHSSAKYVKKGFTPKKKHILRDI